METMTLDVHKQASYSKLNFWLRAFGVYYIIYIVHFVLISGYTFAALIVAQLNMLLGFLTGRRHYDLTDFVVRFQKWNTKANLAILGFIEPVPNIDIYKEANDENFELKTSVPEAVSRGYCILRLIGFVHVLLVPHYLYMFILAIGFYFMYVIGFVVILFTGQWMDATYNFGVGVMRYGARINLYALGLEEKYPSFSLS